MKCENTIHHHLKTRPSFEEKCINENAIYHDLHKMHLCSFCGLLFDYKEEVASLKRTNKQAERMYVGSMLALTFLFMIIVYIAQNK